MKLLSIKLSRIPFVAYLLLVGVFVCIGAVPVLIKARNENSQRIVQELQRNTVVAEGICAWADYNKLHEKFRDCDYQVTRRFRIYLGTVKLGDTYCPKCFSPITWYPEGKRGFE